MITLVTISYILIHSLIMYAVDYPLLQMHSYYIVVLIVKIWMKSQPVAYKPSSISLEQIAEKQRQGIKTCIICLSVKPPRYYHCRRCQNCIYKMDHHCIWLSNCIGHFNAKIYLHLLVNIMSHSLLNLMICLYHIKQLFTMETNYFYLCIVVFPSSYAFYQTQRLIRDFYKGLANNQTLVQSYKQVYGTKITPIQAFSEYFGGKFCFNWFLPFFIDTNTTNFNQKTWNQAHVQIKQKKYADEYLYGSDSDHENQLNNQLSTKNQVHDDKNCQNHDHAKGN